MSNLLDLLIELVTDTQKQRAFVNNREAVTDGAGLSEADRIALKSGDRVQVAALFSEELFQITFFEPNPDPLPDPDPLPPAPPDPAPPEQPTQQILHQHT
ncbi:hypothetical protein QUA56_05910 [Microcoleus sp. N3A4]|uniref:hypothetical protein n=1 Tax=Microcoleus sp. N3A4 TaxID=3055379 RepID=UPI002FCEB67E